MLSIVSSGIKATIAFSVFSMFALGARGQEISLKACLLTDTTGYTEKLLDPTFKYPDTQYDLASVPTKDHLPIFIQDSPRRVVSVHFTQIRLATFKPQEKKGLGIRVALDTGEVIAGSFGLALVVAGIGELGRQVSYDASGLKSIEFQTFRVGSRDTDRREASASWKGSRKPVPRWLVMERGTAIEAPGLSLQDPGWEFSKWVPDRRVKRSYAELTFERGPSTFSLPLEDLDLLELTGEQLGVTKLEAIIVPKKTSAKRTVGLVLHEQIRLNDLGLQWQKPYGFEEVSLLPLRRIVIKPTGQ